MADVRTGFYALLTSACWHPVIWRALRGAIQDYFGRVGVAGALRLFD